MLLNFQIFGSFCCYWFLIYVIRNITQWIVSLWNLSPDFYSTVYTTSQCMFHVHLKRMYVLSVAFSLFYGLLIFCCILIIIDDTLRRACLCYLSLSINFACSEQLNCWPNTLIIWYLVVCEGELILPSTKGTP